MFRLWKVAYFANGFAPLMDAADAGGGGGDAGDPGDGGAGDTPADDADEDGAGADAGDGDARGSSEDDDDEDDDEDLRADADLTPERFKRVAAKLRKLSRRDRRFTPLRARIKELQDAGLSLDDLVTGHRNYQALDAQIRRNPRLRALVHGDDDDADTGGRRSRHTSTEDEFDETSLPFDPNESPTNRYFANMAKANYDLRKQLTQIATRLDRADGRDTQRSEREDAREWKTVLDGALTRIKHPSIKSAMSDAVVSAFQRRASHGKTPAQIVNHYISQLEKDGLLSAQEAKDAKAGSKGQPAGRAATQQRIAENNRNLPRTVAPTGQAVPARTGKERLTDVHKRLRTLSPLAR